MGTATFPSSSFRPFTLDSVSLAEIGDHRLAIDLSDHYAIPPLWCPLLQRISAPGRELLLASLPVAVVPSAKGYDCIGGLHCYRWLRTECSPTTMLDVRVYGSLRKAALRQQILWDLLIAPVLWGVRPRDIQRLGLAWERARDEEVFRQCLSCRGARGLSALLGVDPRRMKKRKRFVNDDNVTQK